MVIAMTAQDRKWEAESDARTLMDSQVISSDKKRLTAAVKAAKRMAAEKDKEAKAMKGIAKRKPKKK